MSFKIEKFLFDVAEHFKNCEPEEEFFIDIFYERIYFKNTSETNRIKNIPPEIFSELNSKIREVHSELFSEAGRTVQCFNIEDMFFAPIYGEKNFFIKFKRGTPFEEGKEFHRTRYEYNMLMVSQ